MTTKIIQQMETVLDMLKSDLPAEDEDVVSAVKDLEEFKRTEDNETLYNRIIRYDTMIMDMFADVLDLIHPEN